MAQSFNFEEIKSITVSVQYSVYGYIRECRRLLPEDIAYYNIPNLIQFTILFFVYDPEGWDDKCVDKECKIFEYKDLPDEYHVFGKKIVERKYESKYRWRIKTGQGFDGILGVIEARKEVLDRLKVKETQSIWNKANRKHNAHVGSKRNGWSGMAFGAGDETNEHGYYHDPDLGEFIEDDDIITIEINYDENKLSFHSKVTDETAIKDIPSNINALKLVAELAYTWCKLTLLHDLE